MVDRKVVETAWRQADESARKCGVSVREMGAGDVAYAQEVIAEAWGPQQVPQSNLLHAVSHAGNPVLLAFRDGTAAGVSFGFLGWTDGVHLHSHMTAVARSQQSSGIGFALKLFQRATCLDQGITEMRWTYDPLIARNAHFNLVKLGGTVKAFFPDFYGEMDDSVNAGDHSDRFEVSWCLDGDEVAAAVEGRATAVSPPTGDVLSIPSDFDSLRRTDPSRARAIRDSTRDHIGRLFAAGLRPHWSGKAYVFGPPKPAGHTHSDAGIRHG